MPIRESEKARYPANWPAISLRIRKERAKDRCECDGRCGHDHGGRCVEENAKKALFFRGKVILTVAHLDHTPENCGDENLLAMCQRCHLAYDAPQRALARSRKCSEGAKKRWSKEPKPPGPTLLAHIDLAPKAFDSGWKAVQDNEKELVFRALMKLEADYAAVAVRGEADQRPGSFDAAYAGIARRIEGAFRAAAAELRGGHA